jgi:parallel beta-helix repeat protein
MRRCAVVAGSLALVLTMQVPAQTVRNITEDWVVSTAERLDNAEVTLRGNLIVQPGGSLTLGNVKLSLGQPPSGMYRIWVQPGGSLTVSRSTLGPLQAGGSFSFVVDGGRLRLETSTVTGLAPWPDTTGFPGFPDGLTIRDAEGAVLEGNTFRQEHPQGGIGLRGSRNATIRNNTVTCATAGGKLVEQCGQVWLDDSHGNIIAGNRFRQACTAVSLRRSSNNEVTENEMTLAVSSGGIVVSDGSGYNRVANNRASNVPAGAGCTAFRIVGTELPNYILGNTFDGFRVAGYIFQAGHAVIAGNQ